MKNLFLSFLLLLFAANSWANFEALKQKIDNSLADQDFESWHESQQILLEFGSVDLKTLSESKEACDKLQSLSPQQLSKISELLIESDLPCRQELLEKSDLILEAEIRPSIFQGFGNLDICNPDRAGQRQFPPTREARLDTRGGPRLVAGSLRPCEVAFTFDDGPHATLTDKLLRILKKEGVRANFFVVGQNVKRLPQVMNRISEDAHVIGNHSWSHKNLAKHNEPYGIWEIGEGFRAILSLWDFTTPFFRYPYGSFTESTRAFLRFNDIAEFFWNMDTRDWALKKRQQLLRRVYIEANREKRGIFLFHDIQPQTIDAMPFILLALKEAGYTTAVFVPEDLIEGDFPIE